MTGIKEGGFRPLMEFKHGSTYCVLRTQSKVRNWLSQLTYSTYNTVRICTFQYVFSAWGAKNPLLLSQSLIYIYQYSK